MREIIETVVEVPPGLYRDDSCYAQEPRVVDAAVNAVQALCERSGGYLAGSLRQVDALDELTIDGNTEKGVFVVFHVAVEFGERHEHGGTHGP